MPRQRKISLEPEEAAMQVIDRFIDSVATECWVEVVKLCSPLSTASKTRVLLKLHSIVGNELEALSTATDR